MSSLPLCEEHAKGQYGGCLVCAGRRLEAALSRISYLCGMPNEMGVSSYDVFCSEDAVVEQVEQLVAELRKERNSYRDYTRLL